MQTRQGIITKIFGWIYHPISSNETITDWFAFFVLALIASYLWYTVIREV